MSGKSFYDLDYIIEINEQRLEQYRSAYHELMGRLTTIVLIYSAMAIFLVPILREVLWGAMIAWVFKVSFLSYAVLFVISVFFTVRFIIPKDLRYLDMPKIYYSRLRIMYEQENTNGNATENLLKASYIKELESTIHANRENLKKKKRFYELALLFALISILPYVICFWFHISKATDPN